MILRGIDFGHVFNASGARNFFGDGWRQTRAVEFFGGWRGSTFVAKTTTLEPRMKLENRLGNMRLDPVTLQPVDWFPDCIWFDWRRGITLNAVGLSGPGAVALLHRGLWQRRREPFFISFMSLADDAEKRAKELREFVLLLKAYLPQFHSRFGLEINITCPNVDLDLTLLVREVENALDIVAAELDIPIRIKINVETSPEAAANIASHPQCDALCVGNTVKFGHLPEQIDWVGMFGTADPAKSPLAKYGGGGLSGPPLFTVLDEWLWEFRKLDQATPISACGGIFRARDALWLLEFRGANAIELGTVATLRPWRVQRIIRAVNTYFEERR